MSSKKNKDVIVSSVIEKEKKNNYYLVGSLIIIIMILSSFCIYFLFFRTCENDEKCEEVIVKEIEVKYQLINYRGFKFVMPLDWDFVSNSDDYLIANSDNNLLISFDSVSMDYDSFLTDVYQKSFLENIQLLNNFKVEKTSQGAKEDISYYLYEGTKESYNYMIVAIGNEYKTILVEAQFQDNVSYNKNKESIIDFAISSLKKDIN